MMTEQDWKDGLKSANNAETRANADAFRIRMLAESSADQRRVDRFAVAIESEGAKFNPDKDTFTWKFSLIPDLEMKISQWERLHQ
jgi:hypothetical protein